ncbi:MAG: TetR family transcriptional regulator [Alphaproteobacteria bacterium]|nr:TetR family transcriptional regulator [Alphaproteobacteria bacterium]
MSSKKKPPARARIGARETHTAMRAHSLAAARKILLERGPAAVTLTAVARAVGRTHGTILHHFGSIEELHEALMQSMLEDLSSALIRGLAEGGSASTRTRRLVESVFDAFGSGGAGVLAAWMALSQNRDQLQLIRGAVRNLASEITERLKQVPGGPAYDVAGMVDFLAYCAFADALIGRDLRTILGIEPEGVRALMTDLLGHFRTS